MRRSRTFLILALALVSGLLAAYAVMRLLEQRTPVLTAPAPSSTQVVVAARPIGIGELLAEEDVKLVNWPGNAAPDGYARSVADVVGRGVIQQVALNEPLLDSKLADRNQGGLQITIPEGMRAIAVRVDEVIGVAGFVTPQTRVDVFLTIDQDDVNGQDRSVTKLVMQNVQALASNQQVQKDPEGNPVLATVITVLVSPEDAEKLILAQSRGRIQMALRNLVDVKEVTTDGARVSELLEGVAGGRRAPRGGQAATTATAPAGSTVEVIKGGRKALIQF